MMRVGLITRHFIANYGSLLQTIATVMAIEKNGHQCEIINYIREDEEPKKLKDSIIKENEKWNKSFLKRQVYRVYQYFNCQLMANIFHKKNGHYLENKTRLCRSSQDLAKLDDFDVYCSGSDQLWGPIGKSEYDPAYFLGFVDKNKRCVSYSGSFGTESLSNALKKQIPSLFSKYDAVSVREQSAKEILSKYNICSDVVLDPTLLITKKEWVKKIGIKGYSGEKYILVYQLHNSKLFDKYVQRLANDKQMEVIYITTKINGLTKKWKKKYIPSVDQFLSYIMNADYVITDSFHGTVFSIIFNKQFVSISPGKTKTRITSLLRLFGLEERFVSNEKVGDSLADEEIEWRRVNRTLSDQRIKSLKWLKNALEGKK